MCKEFDGHHSGGSSFDSIIRCGPYPQVSVRFKKKKKNQVKSPSPESRTPNSVRIRHSCRAENRGVTELLSLKITKSSLVHLLPVFVSK